MLMPSFQICVIMEFIILPASISGSKRGMFKRGLSKALALVPPMGTYHAMPQAPAHPCLLAAVVERLWRKQPEPTLLPNVNKVFHQNIKQAES